MKALRVLAFVFCTCVLARAQQPAGDAFPVLAQGNVHRRADVRPMTLAELEGAALQSNPEIKLAARRAAIAEAGLGAAGALEDPTVMYRGWGVPLREPWNFNQPQNMFMITQALPGPGKRALRSQIAAQGVDVLKAELEARKREVTARVRVAFYELLRNYEELRLHGEQVAITKQGFEAARIKYTVGRAPQQDVLKAQIALSKLFDHLVMFEQEGELARARLNTLLGRDPAAPLEVAGEYALPARLPAMEELEGIALASRPELAAASAAIKQSETRSKLAKKTYTPDFTLGAGYMLMPPGSAFRNTYMAEFSINLPWLNRRRHESEIAEARAQNAALKAEYETRRAVVLQEIREALIRAETARKLVGLYRDTLRPQAQTTFMAASAAYQTDRADFLNLLDSQNMTLEVEYAYFRALSEFEQRLADLERAIGAPLPRDTGPAGPPTSQEVRP